MYKIIVAPDRSSSHILEVDDIGKVIHISDCECTENMWFHLSDIWFVGPAGPPPHISLKHTQQGNQRWQTSPAAPPGGLGHVTRGCACQISWWSVEKWRRYYILKFRGNTFRWPMTLTFDLKFWKYLSVTVYPYVICMPSFIMIGWEMAEILHFEILRKHGQTHRQTDRQTDMGITIPRPPPPGAR